jgi:TetR/AcrR family transcriptional regulator, cholesterol catabolism regulator
LSVEIESQVKDPERVRERRAQIVSAAVRLFSEKGFHKTTTREIAKASGLSNGALYEYVKSKEDILFLVCQHIHNEIRRQLQSRHPVDAPGAAKLRRAIESLFRVLREMQADVLLIYQEAKSLPRAYLREVLRQELGIVNLFVELLREGVEDGSLAVAEERLELLAQDIVVMAQMWAFRRWALQHVSFEQFVEHHTSLLMQAAGARDARSAD